MANVLIDNTKLTTLGNAIRAKTGKSDLMTVAEMAEEVAGISGGGITHYASFPDMTVTLAETNFATWTPSTTAKAILATQTVGTFAATDIHDVEYFSRIRAYINIVYADGTSTAKGMFKKMVGENWYSITRKPGNYAAYAASNRNTNVAESVTNTWIGQYYNTAWIILASSNNGFYQVTTAPTLSSTSVESPTITVRTPVINCKCNATYFSTDMAANVDQDLSTIKFAFDVYKIDSGYQRTTIYESLINMWNNGL